MPNEVDYSCDVGSTLGRGKSYAPADGELTASKAPIEVFVVDRADRTPVEN